jgi:hypothetical protein
LQALIATLNLGFGFFPFCHCFGCCHVLSPWLASLSHDTPVKKIVYLISGQTLSEKTKSKFSKYRFCDRQKLRIIIKKIKSTPDLLRIASDQKDLLKKLPIAH